MNQFMNANDTETAIPPQALEVCQRLCALFEEPSQWEFDAVAFFKNVKPIYRLARDVIRPPLPDPNDEL